MRNPISDNSSLKKSPDTPWKLDQRLKLYTPSFHHIENEPSTGSFKGALLQSNNTLKKVKSIKPIPVKIEWPSTSPMAPTIRAISTEFRKNERPYRRPIIDIKYQRSTSVVEDYNDKNEYKIATMTPTPVWIYNSLVDKESYNVPNTQKGLVQDWIPIIQPNRNST